MSADQPQNPYAISLPPGSATQLKSIGRGGEALAAEIHGKYYYGSYYKDTFSFNVTATTIPVAVSQMVSKFSLYNPPTSSVNLELIDVDLGIVLATTVVNVVGWYWSTPTLASKATLTTIGVFGTNWYGGNLGGFQGQGNPYSALTHSDFPVRVDIISFFGATTTTAAAPDHKDYDGKLLLPPGHLISMANSTAAATTSSSDIGVRWLEAPVT